MPKTLKMCKKKACLVWSRMLQFVWQIACLKQQCSLFLWNTKILQENHVYLLLHWFSGGNCFIRSSYRRCSISKGVLKVQKIHRKTPGQNLFFNKFAGAADILTWKSLNILYRKLMKFLKVLPKENLKSACKR